MQTITWFHKLLAALWICGLIGLGLGISTSNAGTDRFIRSEVGLLRKPMTTASKWLINKQIKKVMGNVDTQAAGMPVQDFPQLILQGLKYVWEKAWQQAILKIALKLLSAVFKIIEQFINKLLDMITSIGNISAVLSPFTGAIMNGVSEAFAQSRACAEYWTRRELQGILPDINTGADDKECKWLVEKEDSAKNSSLSIPDQLERKELKVAVGVAGGRIDSIKAASYAKEFANAQVENQSISKNVKLGCASGDALWASFTEAADCPSLAFNEIADNGKKESETTRITNQISDFASGSKIKATEAFQSTGGGDNTIMAIPKSTIKTLNDKKGKTPLLTVFSPKDLMIADENKKVVEENALSFIILPKINIAEENLRLAGLQSTKTPQPSGGVDQAFQNITEEFSKMLTDVLTKIFENTLSKIVDFIVDKAISAVAPFLKTFGLDLIFTDTLNSLRDGIKGSLGGGRENTSDGTRVRDVDGEANRSAAAELQCPEKVYWLDYKEYSIAKSRTDCKVVDMRFDPEWCKEYNDYTTFADIVSQVRGQIATDIGVSFDAQNAIQATCSNIGRKFEYKQNNI